MGKGEKESLQQHLPREIFPLSVPEQVLEKRPLREGRKAAITESGFPINLHSKRLSHITYDFHPQHTMCLPRSKKDAKSLILFANGGQTLVKETKVHKFASHSVI
ncbi:hypothetical protein AVEN_256032-1 [Araneus ventricosus]|uniref:Uncharacterized protein n=1 Tax=Araneus ventricosus TaxID=182803 RepID=A0A4Y2KCY0_ARAVE|nr:hypothetical protein AVEN_256032-1 [Araneus ventricosus]